MPVRVVVAPDSFGTTLTAAQAASAIAEGWSTVRPDDDVVVKPQSDGGPGFIDCLGGLGVARTTTVTGPLGVPVQVQWRCDRATAYLECEQACGLHLVGAPQPATALQADSAGLGELIDVALRSDPVERLVVGLGGSATTDGGRGMLEALGGPSAAKSRLARVELVVATDVDNPLNGPSGAAAVFAPQKGADEQTVALLAERLVRAGAEWEALAGRPVADEAGAGAAGGVGAALFAVGGRRVSGAALVAAVTGLPAALHDAAVVITGEGRLDEQTAAGKVVAAVAAAARPEAEVIALVGENALADPAALRIDRVDSLVDYAGGRDRALAQAGSLLVSLAARCAANFSSTNRGNRE